MDPRTVGEYELSELLGSGTVGDVYRARHRATDQPAVVKFLKAQTAREPDVQRRFVREVAIAEQLDHPNVVRHYDSGLADDQIYFAMELVECGTLKDVLCRRGRLPWRESVECAIQICAALDHAHARGVIHRDLKPANLFLAEDGRIKVGDFGLARDLNRGRLTLDGQTVGTCRYMPPEQVTGQADLTGAVDLYALGCVLYEMIVGKTPFDGSTIVEVFEAHLYSDPTPPAELTDCPADLSALVVRLLAKQPADRPANAANVGAALEDILQGRTVTWAERPAEELDGSATTTSDAETPNLTERLHAGAAADAAEVPRARAVVVFGVIAVVIIAAIVVMALGS